MRLFVVTLHMKQRIGMHKEKTMSYTKATLKWLKGKPSKEDAQRELTVLETCREKEKNLMIRSSLSQRIEMIRKYLKQLEQ